MQNLIKLLGQEFSYFLNLPVNGKRAKTILFYPEYPQKRTIIYKILKHLKYNITANPKHKSDLVFYWQDSTFRENPFALDKYNPDKIINLNCRDISKEKISDVFKKVAGYNLDIDPQNFNGDCVKKNNLNAKHDGIIINCPVKEIEPGFVYQKLLNNITKDKLALDIRVPVLKGEIPFVYLKYKLIENRFTNDLYKSKIGSCSEYLTIEETEMISHFCKEIGLDYGELDVLRNNDDRRIYIVDVNYTPWGPPAKLPEDDNRVAVMLLSEFFKKIFF
jgi:hypothetical protein